MSKLQILTALLLSYLVYSCAEEKQAQQRIDNILRPPPFIIKTSQAPPGDSSYFSKISNWLKSFGDTEKKTSHANLPSGPAISTGPSGPLGSPGHNGPQTFNTPPSHGPPTFNTPPFSHSPPPSYIPPILNGPPSQKLIPNHITNHGSLPVHSHPSGSSSLKINQAPTKNNQISAQESSSGNRYLPPHPSSDKEKDCNPCNQEPWVPVVSNYGKNTLIGFVPHSDLGNNGNNGKPNGVYGAPNRPPKQYSAPSNQYGPPSINHEPSINHGPSLNQVPSLNLGPPSSQYGPPPSSQYGSPSSPQFGPPPSSQYGPPHHGIQEISPPKLHDIPPSNNYGPPNNGGPPIKYGPPKHKPAFLPTPNPINPNKYGPPPISHPRRPRPHLPPAPSSFMGPPPTLTKYGPPSTNFGQGPSIDYGPPPSGSPGGFSPPNNNYGLPLKPPINYGPPSTGYGPPNPSPPTNNYGPPPSGSVHAPPSKPSGEYGLPLNNFGPPPSAPPGNYGLPPSGNGNQYLPPFPTPTASAVSNNYDFPPSSINAFDLSPQINGHTSFVTPVPPKINNQRPVQNSYEPPPAGPVQSNSNIKITSDEYLPPQQELPITNGNDNNYEALNVPPSQLDSSYNNGIVDPIPFPNMSPTFLLPIRNAHPFRNQNNPSGGDNLSSQGENIPFRTGNGGNIPHQGQTNVQISQSIPVADFLSTIEYPPNVVQSPLIDLVVNDNLGNIDTPQENNEYPKQNNNGYQVNLKDNPIVVDGDEHHQEASDNHASVASVHDAISTKLTFSPNLLNTLEDSKPTASAPLNNTSFVNVQIDPSLQTLLHDENLASIIAKQLLSENNNPPKPFEPSENIAQKQAKVNQNAQATNNALFTQPTLDYSNWNPSVGGLSTGMQPPTPSQSSWISTNHYVPFTTKKPKQIQIIVPYTTNNKENNWHQKDSRKISPSVATSAHNPSISLFGKLPSAEESQWSKYMDHNFQESKTNVAQAPSAISNIQDFFKDTTVNIDASHSQNLPFDILKLQQNIDVWTEQEFNKMRFDAQSSTTSRFAYSKKIPDEYLTTQSINQALNEVTTSSPNNRNSKLFHHDYLASSSVHHSVEARSHNLTELANIDNNLLETNLIGSDISSTQKPEVTPVSWDKIQVSISPVTNERVYVVTPLPWETGAPTPQSAWTYVPKGEIQQINKKLADNANFVFNSPRFAVRPEPVQMNKSKDIEDVNNKIHLVYSDWPELINSLATTHEQATVATPHPLLGRMDISEHTPAPQRQEGTVQTHTGHSKVVTAVTASTVAKKRTGIEDKKFTATTKTATSDKT